MSRTTSLSLILLAVALATGCGSDNSNPVAPTPPPSVTEVFSGTVTINGANTVPFTVQQTGQVSATLTTLSDTTATIGLSLGTLNAFGSCQIIITNDNATQGVSVIGTATSTGNFCARVFDAGRLAAPVDYQVSVTHF
jgi:hypothetical protein